MFGKLLKRDFLCYQLATVILDTSALTTPQALTRTLSKAKPNGADVETTTAGYRKSIVNCQCDQMLSSYSKHIHQETLRYVHPCAKILIESDIPVSVRTCNVHDYPNGNVLIAELRGIPVGNCPATMEVQVSCDEKLVEVNIKKVHTNLEEGNFQCELIIPLRASLFMSTVESAIVENLLSENLTIKAARFIRAKDVHAEHVDMSTLMGNIYCDGTFLSNESYLRAHQNGSITLNKIQGGNKLICQTENGNINVDCSYANFSKFETESGCLTLNNIHMSTQVYINKKGSLKMNGFNGNIQVHMKQEAGSMNIHLSDVSGQSSIHVDGAAVDTDVDKVQHGHFNSPPQRQRMIYISEKIEKETSIDIDVTNQNSKIVLEESLQHFGSSLNNTHQQLRWSCSSIPQANDSYLKITSGDSIYVGKSSWLAAIRSQIMKNLSTKNSN